MKKKRKKRRRRKVKLTPDERSKRKIDRRHKADIRTTFLNCGFEHVPTRGVTIQVATRRGELDGIFLYENILVVLEDTTIQKHATIIDHLNRKNEFCHHLKRHTGELFSVLRRAFPRFRSYMQRKQEYRWEDFNLVYVYCSLNPIDDTYKTRYTDVFKFLDYPYLKYFLILSKTIHKSARFELVKFLGLGLRDIGPQTSGSDVTSYDGLLLPETASSFPPGHKLVSFLVDPNMLLERAYVLRTDSWRDADCLYQRLLIKKKITSMREYLVDEGRVFVNNIIATLPAASVIKDDKGDPLKGADASRITPVSIDIPRDFNAIGIIDGQHRLYSYHEGNDKQDPKIELLRRKQHLLVTGIVYPPLISKAKKQKFEAQLFLEINDKQKRVKGDLKQAIERIVNPYSPIAVAKAVIAGLAASGPLLGNLEVHFYDTGKIKTTSIVSYGLKHIVGLDAEFSLYNLWRASGKQNIRRSRPILDSYVRYCISEINKLIAGFKQALPDPMWTPDKKTSRVLTTTTINGLIFCLRKLIENRKTGDSDYYTAAFKHMKVDFRPHKFLYRSSHWKALGEKLYSDCFQQPSS